MSLDQVMTVPLARQAEYQAQQSNLDEYGLFDLNRMDVDDKSARDFVGQYTNDVSSIADELGTFGNSTSVNTKARELKRRRDKYMNQSGDGYKIQDAYTRNKENEANINKQYAAGNITAQDAERAKMFAKERYTGHQDGDYQEFTPSRTVNVRDVANKFADSIPVSEIASGQGLKEVPGYPGMYQYTDMKQQGRRRYDVDGNNMVSAQQIVAKETKEYLDNNNALQSYYGDQKLYDENFDGSESIQAASDAAQRIYGRESTIAQTRYGNVPQDPEPKAKKPKPFGESGVYSYDSTTRPVFGDSTSIGEIKDNIRLMNDPNSAKHDPNEARKLKNHYDRAIEKFNDNPKNKELVNVDSKISKSETASIAKELGMDIQKVAQLDTTWNETLNGGTFLRENSEGDYFIVNSTIIPHPATVQGQDAGRAYSLGAEGVGKKISKEQLETIRKERDFIQNGKDNYNKELQNHLDIYADNSREYQLLDLKSSDNTMIDRSLKTVFQGQSLGNQTMSVYRSVKADGTVFEGPGNENVNEAIMSGLKNGNWKTGLISFTGENEEGLPMMKVSYSDPDEPSTSGVVEIQLDKLTASNSTSKHVQTYIMNQYRKHGGREGNIIANKAEDRIRYKDITPNTMPDFQESNAIKSKLSTGIRNKLTSQLGNNFKLDLVRANDTYSIIKEDGDSIKWSDIFDSADDFNELGTTKAAQYIGDRLLKATNKYKLQDITREEYESYLNQMIQNNEPIRMNDYKDLLNLLNR